ncbi:uncharacterized protein BDR25DRAFT_385936 [Lindgomyces ingoldianus]|uniref:Uncharacterized protein n=1 Tax=Lindgomyces ingoldianus TaxID=673940 RepID=A0ACB6R765_9PLEO|nr:uncharacterized protein BDR25DRAFT_385936 [Lindgomyces ingoldianus]KAF2474372.1 hypothetical protein BDR25DRAFT_385936 [Lindgomyces ingoldianus]
MSSSMIWPTYPDIPIFLETSDDRGLPKSYGTTPTTPTISLAIENSPGQPVHLSVPTSSTLPARGCSAVWPIPEPPPEIEVQQPRRPLLRFFPLERPRVCFNGARALQCSEKTEFTDLESGTADTHNKINFGGLGIMNGPTKLPSTQTPSLVDEKPESSPNIAERIEQRLWRYSLNGNVIERWLLEIISWIISAICMGAIVGVLIYLRNQPLSKWQLSRIGLTLNAFVSVLSKVASAALLLPVAEALGQLKWSWFQGHSKKMWDFEIFDNASRGPWGSFLLLIRTKGMTLAALGALVTIFALALDPFFQQVVDFPDRWKLQGNSSIPRVVRYDPVYPEEYMNGLLQAQRDENLEAVLKNFFYDNGTQPMLFGNGTRAEVPLSCPTSNCTWPPYETLGVCSQCVNVSQLLTFDCLETRVDWTSNLTGPGTEWTYPNGTVCGYWLNSTSKEPVLMSGYLKNSTNSGEEEALLMRILALVTNPKRQTFYGGSINFKHIRNPIEDFIIVGAANEAPSVYRNETPIAHECVLSWCVKTIRSSYWQATYQEEVTDLYMNETEGPYPWTTIRIDSPQGSGTDTYYAEDIVIDAPSSAVNTISIFDDIFPSFTTVANSSSEPLLRYRTSFVNKVMPNVSEHVDRMATAFTNVIRAGSSKEMIYGDAYDKKTYVSVRWGWLSLPLGLLILSFVFLVATIIKSARETGQVGVRKTSAMATLLYVSKGTPRARAKELRVKLLPKKGWRISGNMISPMTPKAPRTQPPPGWL